MAKCLSENKKTAIMDLIDSYGRISILDIPVGLKDAVMELIQCNKIKKKLYCYDTDYNQHLSTYYLERK